MKQPARQNGIFASLKRAASRGVAVRASRVAFQKELQLETDIEQAKEEVRELRERARKEKDKKERKRLVAAAAKAHTRGVRAAARLNKAKAKRLSTALRVADVYANPAHFDAQRKPHFCADCEKPLQAERMAVMGDGRVICSTCAKKAKDKGAAKLQQALFGADAVPMDTTGFLFNPDHNLLQVVDRHGRKHIISRADYERAGRVQLPLYNRRGGKLADDSRGMRGGRVVSIHRANIAQVFIPNPAHLEASTQYPIKVQGYCIPTHYRARRSGSTGEKKPKASTKKAAKKRATRAAAPGAKKQTRSRAKAEENLSISEFVRRHGGIRPDRDGHNSGEIDRLRPSRTRKTGLVNKNSKYSADAMLENASQYGYPLEGLTDNEFLDLVHDDAMGYYKTYSTAKDDWDFTDRRSDEEIARATVYSQALDQHEASRARANPKRWMRRIRTGAQLAQLFKSNPAAAQAKLFQFPTEARHVEKLKRVQSVDRDRSGNFPKGVVLGQTGEFDRVLFDNYDRAHLVAPHLLREINPARARQSTKAPKPSGATKRKFEAFTGREASRVEQVPCSHLYDQVKGYELGKLVELQTADGKVYKGKGLRLLATAHNKMTIGGKPLFPVNFKLRDDQVLAVSPIVHVVYRQFKPGVGDNKTENYIHLLAEDTGEKDRPWLGRDRYGWAILHSGKYRIEERGIVN